MQAYDRAVQRASPTPNTGDGNPIRYSHACLLTEFIDCLASVKAARMLDCRQCWSEAGDDLILGEQFKKTCVQFTDFERRHDKSAVCAMGCVLGMT